MTGIATRLQAMKAPTPQRIVWPDAPSKGDAADFFKSGGIIQNLERMIEVSLATTIKDPVVNENNEFNENKDEDLEESSLFSLNSWPDHLKEAAFIGPIGRFVEKIAPYTEAAREALLIQALVAAGNAMGRHAYCIAEADHHHTNLFAVVVAGTGARKGSSWGQVKRFLRARDRRWRLIALPYCPLSWQQC